MEKSILFSQAKFGRRPTVCYLNVADLNGHGEIKGIQLRGVTNVLRHHLWIGADDVQ